MPVTLTVSEVRDALYQVERRTREQPAASTTSLLGTWFHECLSMLIDAANRHRIEHLLTSIEPNLAVWQRELRRLAYDEFIKPKLVNHCAALQHTAREVLGFWHAIAAATDWLTELAWTVRESQTRTSNNILSVWVTLTDWLVPDAELACELRQPDWNDSVRLVGVADALLQLTTVEKWCVLEFKLGQAEHAADLGQACLYHLLLSQLSQGAADAVDSMPALSSTGTLSLLRFRPQREELHFSGEQLSEALPALLALIGRLANVVPTDSALLPSSPASSNRPTDEVLAAEHPPCSEPAALQTEPTDAHRELGRGLIRALAEYGVTVTLNQDPHVGPTFLRFPLQLGKGQRVGAVKRLSQEIQARLRLNAEPFVELERGQLVVDLQRPDRQVVLFSQIASQLPPLRGRTGNSSVPVGIDLGGRLRCLDLARTEHSHVLVAGLTGGGKSEWLRAAIAGLLLTNTPETLRLILVDPKRNAFHDLRNSPFLWESIVFPDEQPAAEVLERLVDEMERRYPLLNGADSISQIRPTTDEPLPRLVCVIDEYFDLISRGKAERKEIEALIARLGAKARAADIHLIVATQQPSRETIKGVIDANIAARVGLRMAKATESRMLLGSAGAERLLGHGDLLFKDLELVRLQAPYLPPEEREQIFLARSARPD